MIRISNIETQSLSPLHHNGNSRTNSQEKGSNTQSRKINSRVSLQDMTDQELLIRCREGDARASFSEIYRRYGALVMGVCMKYLKDTSEANDACSEVFARLWEKLQGYSPENLKAWLYSVARNHALQVITRDKYRILSEPLEDERFNSLQNEESREAENREMIAETIAKALGNIPEQQRKCIQLFFFDKKSYIEIAKQTGLELKRVKSNLQNGRRNLKLLLQGNSAELMAAISA